MYATLTDAREALSAKFAGETLEVLVSALVPGMGLRPALSAHVELGATRVGGMPDLPPGLDWPIRPVPDDIEAIAAPTYSHADRLRRYLSRPLPFEFLAQVDLGEVPWSEGKPMARLGELAPGLPTEGRLLFFYDGEVAPWRAGTESCSVIWDPSPVTELARSAIPPELIELNATAVASYVADTNRLRGPSRPPVRPEDVIPAYWRPAQQMRLSPCLTLPAYGAIEAEANAALRQLLEADEFVRRYNRLFDVPRHQLLGVPYACNAHDPRLTAVAMQSPFGDLDDEARRARWPEVMRAAADWRLLLQWSLNDAGAAAYFVMHRADLAARDFSRVVVVYEQ
jgi:hypothetical protein